MKRILVGALAVLAFVVPTAARADSQTWSPSAGAPFGEYHDARADSTGINQMVDDPTTGDMTVARLAVGNPTAGGLGCGGAAPFAYFFVNHVVQEGIDKVTVNFTNAVLDGFTWIKVITSIVGGEGEMKTSKLRGPFAGDGSVTVDHPADALGGTAQPGDTVRIAFGIETVSSCPTVDGGRATFTSVSIA